MSTKFDDDRFMTMFNPSQPNDKDGEAIKFGSQNSEYRVYVPKFSKDKSKVSIDSNGAMTLTLEHNHCRRGVFQTDDVVTSTINFDANGTVTDHGFKVDGGGAVQISDNLEKDVVIGVELLGLATAPFSEGISLEVADEVVADIKAFCTWFNRITGWVAKWTDDGGRLNFPAVICQDLNKAFTSTTFNGVSNAPLPQLPKFYFDTAAFAQAMAGSSVLSLDHSDHDGWTLDHNQNPSVLAYSHQDATSGKRWSYETWCPDTSPCRQGAAVLVSCKIDQLRDDKDDHVVLVVAFNRAGNFIAGQASVQSIKHDGQAQTPIVVAGVVDEKTSSNAVNNNFIYGLGNELDKAIKTAEGKGTTDAGFEYLRSIVDQNLHAMVQAIKLK